MLALASIPAVGFFCEGIAVLSVAVVALTVRELEKIPVQVDLRDSKTTLPK
jgi:ribosomal 50S subunit-associated protein YjgA (DUF615 family)